MKLRSSKAAAFTIVELLIAAAITVIIVVMLGTMFGSLANTASRSNQRIDSFREARAALQMIARDFANLVKVQPAAYFVINTDAAGPDVRQLNGLVSLKNKPAGNPAPIAGDLCAVRYYCAWSNNAYSLHRYFRDSALTFQTFQSKINSSNGSLNYVNIDDLYVGSNPIDEVLAAYAWNLQVVAYDSSGVIINPKADVSNHHQTTDAPYVCDPSASNPGTLPAAIEVSFDTISQEAARTLLATTATRPDGYKVWMIVSNPDPNDPSLDQKLYRTLIQPNIYHFSTRISLK